MAGETENVTIDSFKELHEVIRDIKKSWSSRDDLWWRGHALEDWELKPRVYGNDTHKANEESMYHSFKLQAGVRRDKCPHNEDHASWLFLMQHYGIPTRLLDWSGSMLTALFFACNDNDKKNAKKKGALWVLKPAKLNELQSSDKSSDKGKVILTGYGEAAELVLREDMNTETGRILAIFPTHQDIRHLIQSSRFTVHSTDKSLNLLEGNEEFCRKIRISLNGKKSILEALKIFGITEKYLFPDLDHLANDIRKDYSE